VAIFKSTANVASTDPVVDQEAVEEAVVVVEVLQAQAHPPVTVEDVILMTESIGEESTVPALLAEENRAATREVEAETEVRALRRRLMEITWLINNFKIY
jgi:hypothetical protein